MRPIKLEERYAAGERAPASKARRIALAGCGYALLWSAVMLSAKVPDSVLSKVPGLLGAIVISFLGPPVAFVWGIEAWFFVFACVLLTAAWLLISRFCWRRYPDSELFGLPLLVAVAVWIGSAWIAAAMGI